MTLTVRPLTEADTNLVIMYAAAERDDQFKYFAAANPDLSFAVVDENERVAGFITSWQNRFHPTVQQIRIILSPEHVPVTATMDALLLRERQQLAQLAITRPLATMLWEPQTNKQNYFASHGFQTIRKTWLPDLWLDQLPTAATIAPSNVVPLRFLWEDVDKKTAAIQLLQHHYELTHTRNPPRELSVEEWAAMIENQHVLLDWSLAMVSTNRVVALSFVFPGGPTSLDFGWLTDINNDATNVIDLLQIQLQLLKRTQIRSIYGELDNTDPVAMKVKEKFPWSPAPAWLSMMES
ncbi:hypothetical protein [Furfurilactobacillus siliginis]|uniref:N-acetyltransferase domain-containing protein n=1 Tax=Furfurilactobacillus siliginis TaxID=348151 RepID=A0A0R2LBZ9_9LACO|nr:hypothetical protein [Furfurilactobacillus siliginis]KRN96586.1 hypothetical protein IV55_GL001105 [Furfurilactobacillus siliginis]GEK29077.1 hypothetical protein LSI01_13880 [Furfurilactobacillus siliginis]